MTLIKSALRSVILTALGTFILLEVVGFFIFDNRYYWNLRHLSLSAQSISNDYVDPDKRTGPFWKYRPNSEIRSIAVYADLMGADVEYDCMLRTNALGFTDTGPVDDETDIMVLGDSFTEGQGGCPWLTRARLQSDDVFAGMTLLNGALQGMGIMAFERALEYHETHTKIKNVVVIAISNDFKRRAPYHWKIDTPCYQDLVCGPAEYWHFVRSDISETDVIEQGVLRKEAKKPFWHLHALRMSFTYRVYALFKAISQTDGTGTAVNPADYAENLEALRRIKSRYPQMQMLLLPQRDEVGLLGIENLDTRFVKTALEDEDIEYAQCALGGADFMPVDGHPNAQGYDKVFNCLKALVRP